jgi:hypothetical protein
MGRPSGAVTRFPSRNGHFGSNRRIGTFPGAPLGYLVPGDHLPNGQAIPAGIAPTPKDNFSPRIGLAYSPNWSDGFLNKLTGGPGKTSIHFGAGRFFTSPEGLTVAYPTGNPPYGLTYTSPEPPLMSTPFVGALTGTQYIQQFPVKVPLTMFLQRTPMRM